MQLNIHHLPFELADVLLAILDELFTLVDEFLRFFHD
jgi:hypothetical protein